MTICNPTFDFTDFYFFLFLVLYQTERVEPWTGSVFFIRLLGFYIRGPYCFFSFLGSSFLPGKESLSRFLNKKHNHLYTILLVFAFPFGLVGSFRVWLIKIQ